MKISIPMTLSLVGIIFIVGCMIDSSHFCTSGDVTKEFMANIDENE